MSSSPPLRARSRLGQALLRAQSDERLAALARDGSPAAFAALADRYRAELTQRASHLAGIQAADDVVQQTFASAWGALRAGVEVKHPRAWLHQIARHAAFAVNGLRSTEAGEVALREIPSESAEEGYLRRAGAREALTHMAALPERQRRALELTALHDASARRAARELGVNENALRQAVHRARRSLRRAASAITPLTALHWLLPAGGADALSAAGASGAGAGGSALVLKATVAVAAAGMGLGGTAALLGPAHRIAAGGGRGSHPRPQVEQRGLLTGPADAPRRQTPIAQPAGASLHRQIPRRAAAAASAHSPRPQPGRLRRAESRRVQRRRDGGHRDGEHRGTSAGLPERDLRGGDSSPRPSGDGNSGTSTDAGGTSTDSHTETWAAPSTPAPAPAALLPSHD
ncbi:MAG: RNA polymerase sigma factor [Actinobacteria bacterium]|nr:MAG: RNA polymerase sigma factor [Actinomycetota bacterium]